MSRVMVFVVAILAVLSGCKTAPEPFDRSHSLGDCTYQVEYEDGISYVQLDGDVLELNRGNFWADVEVQVAYAKGGVDRLHVLLAPGEHKKAIRENRAITSVAMQACHLYNPMNEYARR